jgi:hypothetical protein
MEENNVLLLSIKLLKLNHLALKHKVSSIFLARIDSNAPLEMAFRCRMSLRKNLSQSKM